MATRFTGRDYHSIRAELIEYIAERSPATWDQNNPADPLLRVLEAIALLGDHLHYYVDALRREADLSTATLASSIYSYALREGYTLALPRSTRVHVELSHEDGAEAAAVDLPPHSIFKTQDGSTTYLTLAAVQYTAVPEAGDTQQPRPVLELAAGVLQEVVFTYTDIDVHSRYELPVSRVDAEAGCLTLTSGEQTVTLEQVEDVLLERSPARCYSLIPSFHGGVERLYLVFPQNHKYLLPADAVLRYQYLQPVDAPRPALPLTTALYPTLLGTVVQHGGYRGYESPESVLANYRHYSRDYSALITKADYYAYVSHHTQSRCTVYDCADLRQHPTWALPPRTMVILTDLDYHGRRALYERLVARASRSDNILIYPYGQHLYNIHVLYEYAAQSGATAARLTATIQQTLQAYYRDPTELRYPTVSKIYALLHAAVPEAVRLHVWIHSVYDVVQERASSTAPPDPDYHLLSVHSNYPTAEYWALSPEQRERYLTASGNQILRYYAEQLTTAAGTDGDLDLTLYPPVWESVWLPHTVRQNIAELAFYHGHVRDAAYADYDYYPDTLHGATTSSYTYQTPALLPHLPPGSDDTTVKLLLTEQPYDSPAVDTHPLNSPEYERTHYLVPHLAAVVPWGYGV